MSATVCDKTNRVVYRVIGFRITHDTGHSLYFTMILLKRNRFFASVSKLLEVFGGGVFVKLNCWVVS